MMLETRFSLSIIDLIESGYSICGSILLSTVSLNLIGCAVETNKPLQMRIGYKG